MHCPVCGFARSRIIRTRPDPESTSQGLTRQCRKAGCGAPTHETGLSGVHAHTAEKPGLRDVALMIAQLDAGFRAELSRMLAEAPPASA